MADPSAQEAVQARLAALQAELAQGHPELYRHLALYLQVLRDGLLQAVRQACFHLVTQVHPHRYGALPAERRRTLQRRLEALVRRCCSLLTVEQLAHLAGEIEREQLQQQHNHHQRLIEALEQRQRETESSTRPEGSVHLALDLPISAAMLQGDHLASLIPGATEEAEGAMEEAESSARSAESQTDEAQMAELETRQAMEAMAEAFAGVLGGTTDLVGNAARSDSSLLPSEPLLLLRWLGGFEQALGRRLRNLSHSLNIELLRLGISQALLPMSLLDAVLEGQLEAQPAPANLLRLPLPFQPDSQGGPGLEAVALLLRPADLELELPPLRTCRRRLQQAQQQVRRMARESARLQRRLATLEAEQLWLQDINAASHPAP